MSGQIQVGGVDVRLIAVGFGDPGLQIVGHHRFGDAAEEFEAAHMGADPLGQALGHGWIQSESVDAFNRNRWTESAGIRSQT